MRILANNEFKNHKTEIVKALDIAEEITICTAFLKFSGLKSLLEKINQKHFKTTFYVGTNFFQTEPNALKKLFSDGHSIFLNQDKSPTFHPKVFYFRHQEIVKIFIGSANLTSGGLESNIETSVECDTVTNSLLHQEVIEQFKYFEAKSKKVEILETILDYENRYNIYRLKHKIADLEFEKEELKIIESERKREEERLRKIEEEKLKTKVSKNTSNKDRNRFAITDEYKESWKIYFEEFKKFKNENGGNTIIPEDHNIYNWYNRQREFYRHKNANGERAIYPEHLKLLDEENFFWGNPNEIIWMEKWENKLARVKAYSDSINQKFAWVTIDKKNKKNPLNDLAQWCSEQRMRLEQLKGEKFYKTKKRKIKAYEVQRLKEINFLEESTEENRKVDEENIFEKLLLIEKLKSKRLSQNEYRWLPSQTDPDLQIADLGGWLGDKLTWIKEKRKKNDDSLALKNLIKDFEDLGIDTENGINGTYFNDFAKKYRIMRKNYPFDNPTGEERKPYAQVIDWATLNRNKFDKSPEWRKKILIELGIKVISPNS
jgi:HKD family nuclease